MFGKPGLSGLYPSTRFANPCCRFSSATTKKTSVHFPLKENIPRIGMAGSNEPEKEFKRSNLER
ncbi:hypothetical protein ACRRTK_002242 [Alexandromys fortis]